MMANVETLAWKLVADTDGFTQGVVATRAELKAAKQIIEGTLTPLDKLSRGLDEAQRLFEIGALDIDQYQRRVAQLHAEYDRATAAEKRLADGMGDMHDNGQDFLRGQLDGLPVLRDVNTEMFSMGPTVVAAAAAIGAVTIAWQAATAAGSWLVDTIVEQTEATLDLTRTAEQLGVRAGVLAGWRDAAGDLSGAVGGELDAALSKMNRNLAEAVQGGGPAIDTLQQLGLSARELVASGTENAFYVLADAIANTENQMERARLATDVFGKSGAQLLNTFAAGSGGLKQSVADAEEIGLALSAIDSANVVALGEAMNQLGDISEGFGNQLTAAAAPGLAALATSLIDATAKGEPLRDLMDSTVVVVRNLADNMGQVTDIGAIMFGPVIVASGIVLAKVNLVTQAIAALDRMAADIKGGENEQLQRAAANLQRVTANTIDAGMRLTEQGLSGEFAKRMEEARQKMAEIPPAVRQYGGALGELADIQSETGKKSTEAAKATTDWADKAAKIHDQVRSPLEKYQERIEELNLAVQLGGLAWSDYESAAAKAGEEYHRASEAEQRGNQRRGAAAGEALAAERSAAAARRELDAERVSAVLRGTQAAIDASARAQAAQRAVMAETVVPPVQPASQATEQASGSPDAWIAQATEILGTLRLPGDALLAAVAGSDSRRAADAEGLAVATATAPSSPTDGVRKIDEVLAMTQQSLVDVMRSGFKDSQQPTQPPPVAAGPSTLPDVERLLQENRDKLDTSNEHLADILSSLSDGLVQVREVTLR